MLNVIFKDNLLPDFLFKQAITKIIKTFDTIPNNSKLFSDSLSNDRYHLSK